MRSVLVLLLRLAAEDGASGKVSLGDIEERLRSLRAGTGGKVRERDPSLLAGATAGALLLAAATYLLGRRRGRRRATVLEIRRV